MINFSGLPEASLLGKALRIALRVVPGGAVLPIIQGPCRGYWWTVGAGNHGYWLGSYELDKQKRFYADIRPGQVVLDIGAHAGFYTLLASSRVGHRGRVIAFEPDCSNLRHLKRHVNKNSLNNVTILEVAVGGHTGWASFEPGTDGFYGRLSDEGGLHVQVIKLDDLWQQGLLPAPDVIKIDIEGGEYLALRGAMNLLMSTRPVIFLSTHGEQVHQLCIDFLGNIGYATAPIDNAADEVIARWKV